MNADKRVESPVPILPLPTPDVETEKLIKRKDEEVSGSTLNIAWQQVLRNHDADMTHMCYYVSSSHPPFVPFYPPYHRLLCLCS